ncbi:MULTISPECIES: HNH endonuclease [unclassified Sphingobium]|uniref:HNH endonuclease n=1 Tax=unclassified Sphingobium TaxID=2611147 RepID=UPI0035A6AEEC
MSNTGEHPRTGAGRALMAERVRPGPVHKTAARIEGILCPQEKPQHSKPLAPLGGLAQNIVMGDEGSLRKRWSEEETVLALYLYFQLPFGKLHSGNPEIQQLAAALGRSSSSVAMKLCNFASLDPKITESGRKGLDGASKLDRTTYAEFGQDWTGLVARAESMWATQVEHGEPAPASTRLKDKVSEFRFEPYQGASTTQALVNQRVGQDFFRRAVLANYEDTCCITGIANPRLLTASHIKPWGKDIENRHNPANGLLLSATLDRAFDRGLITVDQNRRIHVSRQLRESQSRETREFFQQFDQASLRPAKRFDPDPAFLDWHNTHWFADSIAA